ncbi:MAG: hypothetical protein KatS3mg114_0985 [Planctomycetaceae bacterium]|nr:MAG: hypothetical protein KatS3mg114_0985 [Planctomycetaceae bacterium]
MKMCLWSHLLLWSIWGADESATSPAPVSASQPSATFQTQPADDALTPLVPRTPRSPEVQNKLEAVTWYALGRLRETRRDLAGAFKAYRKAAELDPSSSHILRALVPLALQQDDSEEALRWALKALEHDADDYELLLRVGVMFAQKRDFKQALKYLEQAVHSPRLNKQSPIFVMIHLELGMLYQITHQPQAAADSYSVILSALKNPQEYQLDFRTRAALLADPRTNYERVGQVLMEGGRLDLAEEAFALAAKSNRSSPGSLTYFRARLLLLSNKPEQALQELQKYFDEQRQTKGREAYQLLAEILEKLGQAGELLARLEELAVRDPRNRHLQYFFAETLMKCGELERAREVYERTLKSGGDAAGYLGLAAVLRRLQRPHDLLDALGKVPSRINQDTLQQLEVLDTELKAIAADPPLAEALFAAGEAQASAEPPSLTFEEAYLLAKIAEQMEKYDVAVAFYRRAAALDKERALAAFRELADMLLEARRYDEATAAYQEALALNPPPELRARIYLGMIQAQGLADHIDDALQSVHQAQQDFPQLPIFHFQEAWIYYQARRLDEALTAFEKIVQNFPQARDLVRRSQYSISNIYVLKKEMRKAEEVLEKILEEDPDDPAVNNDLGYLYADQGKHLEKAEIMIRKAVQAEPENAAYLDSLGWVLFKRGRAQEAIPHLEKAASLPRGEDATIWDHLGDCYLQVDQPDKAQEAWKKALEQAQAEKHPDTELIEKIKQKLGISKPVKPPPE